MLKKRLVGVVTVRQGWAVQSFGYSRYLPLGKPECLVENLDRWGVDEIFIQDISRSKSGLGPNLGLIQRIAQRGISTPILYAGGISSKQHAVQAVRAGVERICVDALLWSSPAVVESISQSIGAQAVVASFPLVNQGGGVSFYNYISKVDQVISERILSLIENRFISEAIVIDAKHEGFPKSFDEQLIKAFDGIDIPIIPFGGISEAPQIASLLERPSVSAIGIGNFLNYREHAVQLIKRQLSMSPIRQPYFQSRGLV